jgi:shikimate 5-dehydrogenase
MVVNQGIISIAYLAGIRPDPDAMRDALTKALQR